MGRRRGASRPEQNGELGRLIRQSRVLDPVLKRQWLRVLPHLAPEDRARLREILESAQESGVSGDPPTSS